MKVLLTGFDLFGDYKYNPTKDLAKRLDGKIIAGARIIGEVLPCSYRNAAKVVYESIVKNKPDLVVSFGLASRVPTLRFEIRGQNIMNSHYADSEGKIYSGIPIIENDKQYYYTSEKTSYWASKVKESGIDTEISNDAEGFICNTLVYLISKRLSGNQSIPFVFIHTPWTDNYADRVKLESGKIMIPENSLEKTVEIIISEYGSEPKITKPKKG